jgi:hypothetical protein
MATSAYMSGRKKYARPQAILFSNNAGRLVDGAYIPFGTEVDSANDTEDFLILSDDNRSPIEFSQIRIEKRERMINGRMRSFHIADKLSMSVSWDMLPSRSFDISAEFNQLTGKPIISRSGSPAGADLQFTTDGGAGGADMLDWYENHPGSFWVFLAYDKYTNFSENPYAHITKYNEIVEMQITDFTYSVQKRSRNDHDLWNISISLEEV